MDINTILKDPLRDSAIRTRCLIRDAVNNKKSYIRAMFYDVDTNTMFNEDNRPIFNIYSIITPNEFYLFKLKKEYLLTISIDGDLIELYYPEECEQH